MAEAFRSALFIVMSGAYRQTDETVGDLRATDEPWFQRAFTEAWRDRPDIEPVSTGATELRQFLIEAWLEDQIRYHRTAVERFHRAHNRLTSTVVVLFSAAVLIGLLHAFEVADSASWTNLFTFLTIALPGFGAALVGIRDQRQYRLRCRSDGNARCRLTR